MGKVDKYRHAPKLEYLNMRYMPPNNFRMESPVQWVIKEFQDQREHRDAKV